MRQTSLISTVALEDAGLRLDQYLYSKLGNTLSREKLKQAVLKGSCSIDDAICALPSKRLKAGMRVVFSFQQPSSPKPLETLSCPDLEVIYKDNYLAVINKPAGLTTHPAASVSGETLVDYLRRQFPQIALQEGDRPGVVHRLDKDTSGLICVALTEECRLALAQMFVDRLISKEYLALVRGVPAERGHIQTMFGRRPGAKVKMSVLSKGRLAETRWRTLYSGYKDAYSLVSVAIHTGRTHQIRVHMEHIGHPILGDRVYAEGKTKEPQPAPQRQMLHAWRLAFNHPVTGNLLSFSCPPPKDFFDGAWALEKRPMQVALTGVAGCGKSAVLKVLEDLGASVWSADKVVERLYRPGGDVWKVFWERYGTTFIPDKKSSVDREKLWLALSGELDVSLTVQELSKIVHPFVLQELALFWEKSSEEGVSFAVAEVPLWFESAAVFEQIKTSRPWLSPDMVVGVFCPKELRRELLAKREWSLEKQKEVDCWHFEQEKKLGLCSYVIKNTGDVQGLEVEVKRFFLNLEGAVEQIKKDFRENWDRLVL